jgi:hypothetical protein
MSMMSLSKGSVLIAVAGLTGCALVAIAVSKHLAISKPVSRDRVEIGSSDRGLRERPSTFAGALTSEPRIAGEMHALGTGQRGSMAVDQSSGLLRSSPFHAQPGLSASPTTPAEIMEMLRDEVEGDEAALIDFLHLALALEGAGEAEGFEDEEWTSARIPSAADFDHDGVLSLNDVPLLLQWMAAGEPRGDLNLDGSLDAADIQAFWDRLDSQPQ